MKIKNEKKSSEIRADMIFLVCGVEEIKSKW